MKKRTAKKLVIVLAFSYLITISAIVLLWMEHRSKLKVEQTLSEALASDNSDLGKEDDQENQIGVTEEITSTPIVEEEIHEEEGPIDEVLEPTPSPEVTPTIVPENVGTTSMVFTGDVYLGNYVSSVYDANGIQGILSETLLEKFQMADFAMVNQEFPFSLRGTPMENKQYTFRVNPEKVRVFQEMEIDMVSLANNHAIDYGQDAFLDTLDTLAAANITYVGVGRDLVEAKTTRYIENKGKKIAVLSASRVIPVTEWGATAYQPGMFTTYDPSALIQEIKEAKENADYIIVYVHWGKEHQEFPENYQRIMGKQFIDAGADVVIGSHPHVLQGFEYYNGKL